MSNTLGKKTKEAREDERFARELNKMMENDPKTFNSVDKTIVEEEVLFADTGLTCLLCLSTK